MGWVGVEEAGEDVGTGRTQPAIVNTVVLDGPGGGWGGGVGGGVMGGVGVP